MLLKILSVILGILMVVTGVYCMTLPEESYFLISVLMGAAVVAAGIGFIVVYVRHKKQGRSESLVLVCGILTVLMGLFILGNEAMQWGLSLTLPTFVAAWLLVTGIIRAIDSFALKDMKANADNVKGTDALSAMTRATMRTMGQKWWVHLIIGIIMIILGILAMLNPITTALTLGVLLGIGIVVSGIDLILLALAI